MDLAFYHSHKAFYFYLEFIEQITDEKHTFLKLNSRDASLFVYKKTIFDVNNEYRKQLNPLLNNDGIIDILYTTSKIIKHIFLFYFNKKNFLFNKETLQNIIQYTEIFFEKINEKKMNLAFFESILTFIENLDDSPDSLFVLLEEYLNHRVLNSLC
jgi:hypothetical protein